MTENIELSLLCTETNIEKNPISQMGFDLESEEEIIKEMMEKEKQHLPSNDYIKKLKNGVFDLNVRRKEALNWICKACEEHQFGPMCICLSMNYFDRLLSVYDLPIDKAWTLQLLAVACLSLAAKIQETQVPLLIDLQVVGDPEFVFEAKSVQRMELLVLNRLKWRLGSITPCSYIRYFLRKISNNQEPSNTLLSRSLQVIANTTKGIDFMEYRPCEVAAAVALSASGEMNTVHFDNSPLFSLFQKERMKKIGEMIESDGSCSQTPNGVLEVSAYCFSSKTLLDSSYSPHKHPS